MPASHILRGSEICSPKELVFDATSSEHVADKVGICEIKGNGMVFWVGLVPGVSGQGWGCGSKEFRW